MTPLRFGTTKWHRTFSFAGLVAFSLAILLVSGSSAVAAKGPQGSRKTSGTPSRRPGPAQTPANKPSDANSPVSVPLPVPPEGQPEFADAYPSGIRPATPDLELKKEDERKAGALASFGEALLAEDNADSDAALAGYRKVLELDPSYSDLAIKVAYELARRNDVYAGIQILKDAIKAAPKEPMPLVYLSQLYSKHLKKPDLALKYAEQALNLAPENIAGYLAAYEIHIAASDPKKAEGILEKASRSTQTDPKFWLQVGNMYRRLFLKEDGASDPKDLEKMNAVYRKAAELAKSDGQILAEVGDYFVLSRQVKDAIPYYLQALDNRQASADPPLGNVQDKLARAFIATQQRDEAIAILEKITTENPLRFEPFELLGELYEQQGDLHKALANYEHSILLDASQPQNYLRVADMFLRTKNLEKAVETMKTARARFPDLPQITFSLAIILSQAKHHTEAMTAFAEAQAEAENSQEELLTSSFYFQYGAAAEQAGLTQRAAELLQQSIDLDPNNAAQAYNYLGYMWVDRSEKVDEGGAMIRKALEMDPDNGAYLDSLGWFYYRKGEYDKALPELLRAADNIKPPDGVVFDHTGDTYQAMGKAAEALSCWQKALALMTDDEKAAAKVSEKIETAKQKVTSTTVPPVPAIPPEPPPAPDQEKAPEPQ